MRRFFLIAAALLAPGACTAARRSAPAAALPADAEAVVTRDAFVIAFPPVAPGDTAWPAPSAAQFPGYYDWRFGTRPTFVASFGVHRLDTALAASAHGSLGAVVAASRLHRCSGMGTHMLVCADALAGEGRVEGRGDGTQRVVVAVRDSGLLAILRTDRPAYAWRSVWRPGGSAVSPDSVRILYEDR